MFFEGPEKKVEILVNSQVPSLRSFGEDYWRHIVEVAQAQILSKFSNDKCDAYLLSESSLFVYDNRMIMITCGQTTLVKAVNKLMQKISKEQIQTLIYERKNEIFPEYQESNFYEDAKTLKSLLPGKAYRFGDEDSHHVHLFHYDKPCNQSQEDMTLEILMHGVDVEAQSVFFSGPNRSIEYIRKHTGVCDILPGYKVDDHLFEPQGYSLNAIKDNSYYTIHVTPQKVGSYVSFETNHRFQGDIEEVIKRVLEIFQPKSCDVVFFHSGSNPLSIQCDYELRDEILHNLECGYLVQYYNFFKGQEGIASAVELNLEES